MTLLVIGALVTFVLTTVFSMAGLGAALILATLPSGPTPGSNPITEPT